MSQKIRIKLKSYDYNLVDKSADKIVKTVKTTGAVVTGPIPLQLIRKFLLCCAPLTLIKNLVSNLNYLLIKDYWIYIVLLPKQLML